MGDRKIVQTELEGKEYEILRRVVEKRGMTIKQGLREAIQQWVAAQIPIGDDPLFRVKPIKTGVETDASNLDGSLYGEAPP